METLNLNFTFSNGDNVNVDVDSDTILEEAWRAMVQEEVIKPLPEGKVLLITNADGQPLDVKRTVADCNIRNNDTLRVYYEGQA